MELYPDSHHLSELDLYNVLMVALMVKNLPAMQEPQVRSLGWVGKIPWRKEWHSSILAQSILRTKEPGRLHTVHGVAKSWT